LCLENLLEKRFSHSVRYYENTFNLIITQQIQEVESFMQQKTLVFNHQFPSLHIFQTSFILSEMEEPGDLESENELCHQMTPLNFHLMTFCQESKSSFPPLIAHFVLLINTLCR